MKCKLLFLNHLLLLCFCIYFFMCHAERSERHKRYLSFPVNSKFFVRFNIKENVINWTNIFAQSQGFKFTFDMPTIPFGNIFHNIVRRDLHGGLELLLNSHGIDGRNCIKLMQCLANRPLTASSKNLERMVKIVFRTQKTVAINQTNVENCQTYSSNCPLSLLKLSQYTDDI